jgi:hypothetical protein
VYERFEVEPQICERAYRNCPLTEEQKANNNIKSGTRSRIENVLQYVTIRTNSPPATSTCKSKVKNNL